MKKNAVCLESVKSIAFVASPRLGDGLLSMIVSHNLRRSGFQVTTFNNYLAALQPYFPEENIQPYPSEANGRETLSQFDLLIYMANYNVAFGSGEWHPRVVILDDYAVYHRPISMVDIQVAVCKEIFGLTDVVRTNGLKPPPQLQFRRYTRRVAIHPSASSPMKEWPPRRFIELARRLMMEGYQPVFVIAPAEKSRFQWIFDCQLACVADPALDFLPRFLYESGWFIGNDSGIGHLASNLGIPTVTLLGRQSVRRRWQPGWTASEALLPWMPLFLRPWKARYWKYFISVKRVLQALHSLDTNPEMSGIAFAKQKAKEPLEELV